MACASISAAARRGRDTNVKRLATVPDQRRKLFEMNISARKLLKTNILHENSP